MARMGNYPTQKLIEGFAALSHADTPRLDAVQGNSEARTELYGKVLLGSTGADDAVMGQESWEVSELGSEAGHDGGGVW